MPENGQQGQRPAEQSGAGDAGATAAPAVERLQRFTAANMVRSLLPLVVICLALVGWSALKYNGGDPVRTVETATAERAVSELAGYQLLVPRGLSDGWRATSVHTDAGSASAGDPVTLQIGWYTPGEEYATYVVSDDPKASALTDVLHSATADGTEQAGGAQWQRLTTRRGETALTRTEGTATLLVTGSAKEDELVTLAGSLQPYTP
jgi:hypothetical protein